MGEKKTISWKVLKSGQVAPHKDSIYKFEIETDIHENQVKEFCFTFLHRVNSKNKGNQFNGSCNFPFGLSPFYSFSKLENNKYHYIVCRPYTG